MSYPPTPDQARVTGMPTNEQSTVRQGPDRWKIDAEDGRGVSEVTVRQVTSTEWTDDPTVPLEDH